MKKVLLILMVLTMVSCQSLEEKKNSDAIKELERGNYKTATLILRDAIAINPEYLDGMVNYRNSYPFAVEEVETAIEKYKQIGDYSKEAASYEELIKLKEGLYTLDPIVHNKLGLSLNVPSYENIRSIKELGGAAYYNAGNKLEKKELIRYEKRAKYYLYKRGKELNPDYQDIRNRTETSRKDALILVNISDITGKNDAYKKVALEKLIGARIKNRVLEDEKLKDIVVFKDISQNEEATLLKKSGNLNSSQKKIVNTIIKINIDFVEYEEPNYTERYADRYWNETYYVTLNGKKVRRYRERLYTEYIREKTASLTTSLTYEMIDIVEGRTIGSGSFTGVAKDTHKWRTIISGKTPRGVVVGKNRNLKTKTELLNQSIIEVSEKLGKDIKGKI